MSTAVTSIHIPSVLASDSGAKRLSSSHPAARSALKAPMCSVKAKVGRPRARSSHHGGIAWADTSKIKSHGERVLSMARTSVSDRRVHAKGNRRTLVRSVATDMRKKIRAASGKSGALSSSITTALGPSQRETMSQRSCAANVRSRLKSSHAPVARKSAKPVTTSDRRRA